MKSNTHKIADAMACVSREVINQTINLKEELVDSMKNETEYDKPCPSTYRTDTLSLSLDKPISQSDVEGISIQLEFFALFSFFLFFFFFFSFFLF
jgi:hypothetical protein